MKLTKVSSSKVSYVGNQQVCWLDQGYYWLQFAPVNQNYWLTVMFDENKKTKQYYFDITDFNSIHVSEDSYFYDLYLDIVISNGEIFILDEDELIQAYQNHDIDDEQYQKAIDMKNQLFDYLNHHLDEFEMKCRETFNYLFNQLNK